MTKPKSNTGFASMDAEKKKAIQRKGGLVVSQNRHHMSLIGLKGVEARRKIREELKKTNQ